MSESNDATNIDDDTFTMSTVTSVYKNKIHGGVITLWVFALASLIGGLFLVMNASPDSCKDAACSINKITVLSFGVMGICTAGFLALVGFMIMVGSSKRHEASHAKEETILRQALQELHPEASLEDLDGKLI